MDQYPKLIFDFVDQYPCILWISIPNSFLILWISIPVSCGSVSQINFKKAPDKVVKRWSKQWDSQRVAQGLHRGRRGSAQRAHREHAVPILPNFFAFQAREMKFGEQNGIMTSESFQIFGGTRSFTNSLWHTVISNSLWHTVIFEKKDV